MLIYIHNVLLRVFVNVCIFMELVNQLMCIDKCLCLQYTWDGCLFMIMCAHVADYDCTCVFIAMYDDFFIEYNFL